MKRVTSISDNIRGASTTPIKTVEALKCKVKKQRDAGIDLNMVHDRSL